MGFIDRPIQTHANPSTLCLFFMDSTFNSCDRLGNLLGEPTPSPQIDPLPSSPRQRLHLHTLLLEPVLLPRHALALVAPRRDEAFGRDDALPWDVACGGEGLEGVSDVSTMWGQDQLIDVNRHGRCGSILRGDIWSHDVLRGGEGIGTENGRQMMDVVSEHGGSRSPRVIGVSSKLRNVSCTTQRGGRVRQRLASRHAHPDSHRFNRFTHRTS